MESRNQIIVNIARISELYNIEIDSVEFRDNKDTKIENFLVRFKVKEKVFTYLDEYMKKSNVDATFVIKRFQDNVSHIMQEIFLDEFEKIKKGI